MRKTKQRSQDFWSKFKSLLIRLRRRPMLIRICLITLWHVIMCWDFKFLLKEIMVKLRYLLVTELNISIITCLWKEVQDTMQIWLYKNVLLWHLLWHLNLLLLVFHLVEQKVESDLILQSTHNLSLKESRENIPWHLPKRDSLVHNQMFWGQIWVQMNKPWHGSWIHTNISMEKQKSMLPDAQQVSSNHKVGSVEEQNLLV